MGGETGGLAGFGAGFFACGVTVSGGSLSAAGVGVTGRGFGFGFVLGMAGFCGTADPSSDPIPILAALALEGLISLSGVNGRSLGRGTSPPLLLTGSTSSRPFSNMLIRCPVAGIGLASGRSRLLTALPDSPLPLLPLLPPLALAFCI